MKTAVVTGASSGMGREFVKRLSEYEKFDEIWVIARSKDKLDSLKAEVETPLRVIPLDLTNADCLESYSELLKGLSPSVSLLINCSGFGKFGSFEDIPLSESLNMIDLNCKALTYITETTVPFMSRGGRILQLCSLSAFQPVPYLNVYAATKAYVLSYTRALNIELKSRGIKAMAVCPGWVKTDFFERAAQSSSDKVTYFNRIFEAEKIVEKSLKDLYKTQKDVSVYGASIKLQALAVKLLPHRLVMKIWTKQQKQ